ncbi:kinase-like domain-containing protein [Aspergillus egyptiacus]|nr:kinase-like domain-containing protein [Aspergillus egyptiacus]
MPLNREKSFPRAPSLTSTSSITNPRAYSSEATFAVKPYAQTISDHMLEKETPARTFITYHILAKIWSTETLKEFAHVVGLGVGDQEIAYIRDHLLRTFSALVFIRWDEWPNFRELFLTGPRSTLGDKDEVVMQLSPAALNQGLGSLWGCLLSGQLPVFNPIVIRYEEDDDHPQGSRLPFLSTTKTELGEGGYGKVTKETIPAGQYRKQGGELNETDMVVARKVFHSKPSFQRERRNLKHLVASLLRHEHILVPLAMVTVGDSSSIVMELAECNLETFLQERWEATANISLGSLVAQVEKLANALHHLHNPRPPDPKILHIDLKPENILIKWRKRSPEGHWMLSDFGLARSILTQTQVPAGYLAHGQSGVAMPRQHISPYQPPDDMYVPTSDVWSLGCIFCRVVCRKRYGIDELKAFDTRRGTGYDTDGEECGDDFFHRKGDLNPHVRDMLDRLSNDPCEMTRGCGSLLYSILSLDRDKRPTAEGVQMNLSQIRQMQEGHGEGPSPVPIDFSGSGESVTSSRDSIGDTRPTLNRFPSSHRSSLTAPVDMGSPSLSSPGPGSPEEPDWNVIQTAIEPLFLAIKNQSEEDALIQLKALRTADNAEYLNATHPKDGMTLLGLAAQRGYTHVVGFLIDSKAGVDKPDRRRNTPLMYACMEGHCETAERLLDCDADWNLQGADQNTCLHFATEANHVEILELFTRYASRTRQALNANQVNRLDRTALEDHLRRDTSQRTRPRITELLLTLRAEPDYRSERPEHESAADLVVQRRDTRDMEAIVSAIKHWRLPRDENGKIPKIPRDMRSVLQSSNLI